MQQLLAAFFTLFVTTHDAKSLMSTAKNTRLTLETAAAHIAAARYASDITDLDPDLLLAVAYHESRYETAVVGPLVRGKRACGVMQPVPISQRCPRPSLFRGYLDGAQHLATWIRVERGNLNRALIGYAGGYALLRLCTLKEPPRACSIARVHLSRAMRVKRARAYKQL